jgi:hypothetical protein
MFKLNLFRKKTLLVLCCIFLFFAATQALFATDSEEKIIFGVA